MTADPAAEGRPLEAILAVQDLDTTISQLVHRRATLEERAQLHEAEDRLAVVAEEAGRVGGERADLVERQRALESQIETTGQRRRAIEQRLYSARGTPSRDLQAMDEEIRHLDRRQADFEEAQLELMVAQEPLDAALGSLSADQAQLESAAESLRAAVTAAEAVLDAELVQARTQRATAAAGVPGELLSRYESLRSRLGGVGAARLVGNRCSGCHLELPSMEVDRIRHLAPGSPVTCDQCGRILVLAGDAGARPTR